MHRGAAARGRPDRAGARRRRPRPRRLRARPVRQRPPLRRVEHAGDGAQGRLPHRADRPLRRAPGARRPADPAGAARARPAVPRRRRARPRGCSSRSAGRSSATPVPLDPQVPRVGRLALRRPAPDAATVRLADALNHLYVLLPVLDDAKHYWVSTDEVDKLIRAGGDWLAGHPERALITRRYLAHRRELTADGAGPAGRGRRHRAGARSTTRSTAPDDRRPAGAAGRAAARRRAGRACGRPARVGSATSAAARACWCATCSPSAPIDAASSAIDVSARALQIAARKLRLDRMTEHAARAARDLPVVADLSRRPARRPRRRRAHGGHRARRPAAARRARAPRVRPRRARRPSSSPRRTSSTTCGSRRCPPGALRHRDHRFEWTRAQFRDWAGRVAGDLRLRRALPAGRHGRSRGRPADPARDLHQETAA